MKDIFIGVHFKGKEAEEFLQLKEKWKLRANSEVCRRAVLCLAESASANENLMDSNIRKGAAKDDIR